MSKADQQQYASVPRILYNRYTGDIEGEAFVSDHIFSYIISGTHEIWIGDKRYSFKEGDYRFFRRNQLTKSVKKPAQEGFRSIAVHIDQNTLKSFSDEYQLKAGMPYIGGDVLQLKSNGYLEHYITSLSPYFNGNIIKDDRFALLKTKELLLILLDAMPALKNLLFDFSEPGKIDLEAFMNTHYRYNVTLEQFSFLTGRSLSGFKRDFMKMFNMTPNRWLVKKRLEEAYYLIEEKKKRPSDIYLDLGFMDLSHFSFAYKKAFGKAPTGRAH